MVCFCARDAARKRSRKRRQRQSTPVSRDQGSAATGLRTTAAGALAQKAVGKRDEIDWRRNAMFTAASSTGFEYFPYNVEFGPVIRCQHPHPGPSRLRALQNLPRPVCSPPSASPPSTPSRPPPPPPRRRRAADDDERLVMPSHGVEPASPYEGINACGRIKEQMSDEGPKKFSKPARTSAAIYAVVQRSRKANLPANRKVYRGGSGAR